MKITHRPFQMGWVLMLLLPATVETARAQSALASSSNSGIEILKLKWEKQARLPRNFDPSVIPDNDVFSTMQARTAVPGSTQAPYNDDARREAAQRSAALAPVDYFPKTPGRMPVLYVYSLTIRNIGSKAIEGIAWDYVFLDSKARAVLGNHQLLSYTKCSGGKTVTLHVQQRTRPVTVVAAQTAERQKDDKPKMIERAVIECVMYADGSMWKNPMGKGGSCETLKQHRPINQTERRTP